METRKSMWALAKTWIVSLLMVAPLLSWTQVGIGTTSPHPSSMLHIAPGAGSNKGVLLPSISSASRVVLDSTQNIAHGLIFFDTDLQKFYYFHQSPKQWFELDHDWIRKDVAGASPVVGTHIYSGVLGNVGIGTLPTVNPAAKLTVVGNQSIGSASFTQDSVPPANSLIVQTWIGIGTQTRSGANRLDVKGSAKVSTTVTAAEFIGEGVVPAGTITMFSGATYNSVNFDATGLGKVNTPYSGWALCNGMNNSPDLRGRFVVGSRSSANGNSTPGFGGNGYVNTEYNNSDNVMHNTGGEALVTLNQNQIPAHTHAIDHGHGTTDPGHNHHNPWNGGSTSSGNGFDDETNCGSNKSSSDSQTGVTVDDFVGSSSPNVNGGGAHENRPPYYVLAYMMKL